MATLCLLTAGKGHQNKNFLNHFITIGAINSKRLFKLLIYGYGT